MGIDYNTGTTFYTSHEFTIHPCELFPYGLKIEVVDWQGNIFNITSISSAWSDATIPEYRTRFYRLRELTEAQRTFIRDNLAKHYIMYRKTRMLTEGIFKLEEDTSKYGLRDHRE